MILRSVKLHNFRSYKKWQCEFSPAATLIIGRNCTGKTNILEALFTVATGKSFRAEVEKDMVAWGQELARIILETGEDILELVITGGHVNGVKTPTKKYLVNGVPRRMVDFVGKFRAVLFWPQDIELITGSPSQRRRYLDSVLVQVNSEYRRTLSSYERGLRQRNKLLLRIHEGLASRSQLIYWDHLLIKAGNFITQARGKYIAFLNDFSLPEGRFQIAYNSSIISEARLAQYQEAEIGAKTTLVGPHRDDMVLQIEKKFQLSAIGSQPQVTVPQLAIDRWKDLASFGSRGEQRLAVLWLKLGELSYITNAVGDRPVLLLDDIFSELDSAHRDLVLKIIRQQQTVITSAEPEISNLVKSLAKNPLTISL